MAKMNNFLLTLPKQKNTGVLREKMRYKNTTLCGNKK